MSVRDGGNTYIAQHGYRGQQDPGAENAAWNVVHRWTDVDEVLAEPSVKLVLKHEDAAGGTLRRRTRAGVEGCQPTISGAEFEVARAGVTKATGLARVCAHLGIDASEVVAFGDNVNDVEMLTWAGHGVAMGNGRPEAMAAAAEVTASNDDDGVAVIVERLLAG